MYFHTKYMKSIDLKIRISEPFNSTATRTTTPITIGQTAASWKTNTQLTTLKSTIKPQAILRWNEIIIIIKKSNTEGFHPIQWDLCWCLLKANFKRKIVKLSKPERNWTWSEFLWLLGIFLSHHVQCYYWKEDSSFIFIVLNSCQFADKLTKAVEEAF